MNPAINVNEVYLPLRIYFYNVNSQRKFEFTYIERAIYLAKSNFKGL